jgi:penicillin-binding protein 1A
MGFDQPRKLGERETGGGLALPIWLKYMQKTLKGVPETNREVPSGISQQGGEVYYQETRPGTGIAGLGVEEIRTERTEEVRDQIF